MGDTLRATRQQVIDTLRPQNEQGSQGNLGGTSGRQSAQGNDAGQQKADAGATGNTERAQEGRPAEAERLKAQEWIAKQAAPEIKLDDVIRKAAAAITITLK